MLCLVHVALFEANWIYVCYYYAMFSSFLSLLNFVTMFIVYATFCSVNVLIFIGSTAGRCLISLKDSVQREENEKRLLQLLFFSVSSASTSTIPAIKEYRSFHGQFVFFFFTLIKAKRRRKDEHFFFANSRIFLEI